MTLLERTQILLRQAFPKNADPRERARILREIAAASGGSVNFEWLKKFAAGKIDNPGVISVQSLHDCLLKIRKRAA